MSTTQTPAQKRVNIPAIQRLPPLADSIKNINTAKQQLPVLPVQPVVSEPVQQPAVQQTVAPTTDEHVAFDKIAEMEVTQAETYMSVGSVENGYAEFDLMSHREKGQEVRYLNIQIRGYSTNERGKVDTTCMAITNKEDFERVKSFFSTLKWED